MAVFDFYTGEQMNGTLQGSMLTLNCGGLDLNTTLHDCKEVFRVSRKFIPNMPVHSWTGKRTLTMRLDQVEQPPEVFKKLKSLAHKQGLRIIREIPEPPKTLIILMFT